jgi:hypothetical protein
LYPMVKNQQLFSVAMVEMQYEPAVYREKRDTRVGPPVAELRRTGLYVLSSSEFTRSVRGNLALGFVTNKYLMSHYPTVLKQSEWEA